MSLKAFASVAALAMFTLAAATDDKEAGWRPVPMVDGEEFRVLLETADDPMFQHPVIYTTPDPRFRFPGAAKAKQEWGVMNMTKQQLRAAVPRQTGLIHTGCPNCNAGPENAEHD